MIKRTTLLFIVALVTFSAAQAQTDKPEAATVGFYRWYLGELNADRYPIDKNKTEIRKRVSARLAKWLFSPAYREYGADYFIDAQDLDAEWAKTVTATGGAVKGNAATAVVTFPKSEHFERKSMTVNLVREAGAWKIDKVRSR